MMFASVSGSPTRRETEEITQIWWLGLKNALYDVNRYNNKKKQMIFTSSLLILFQTCHR